MALELLIVVAWYLRLIATLSEQSILRSPVGHGRPRSDELRRYG